MSILSAAKLATGQLIERPDAARTSVPSLGVDAGILDKVEQD